METSGGLVKSTYFCGLNAMVSHTYSVDWIALLSKKLVVQRIKGILTASATKYSAEFNKIKACVVILNSITNT